MNVGLETSSGSAPESARQSADERGLAGAELAEEQQTTSPARERPRKPLPGGDGLLFRPPS